MAYKAPYGLKLAFIWKSDPDNNVTWIQELQKLIFLHYSVAHPDFYVTISPHRHSFMSREITGGMTEDCIEKFRTKMCNLAAYASVKILNNARDVQWIVQDAIDADDFFSWDY